ncbi:hypothetical protein GCM10023188_45640 [Pontibacter saemangeumensis]|uniref:RDD domain-containing protein n=1 Tax=Pontibacter saemangeumensis TaxID=1084525 RepID=A0ABP8M6E0_9BACT
MQAFYTTSESKEELASFGTRLVAFSLDVLLVLTLVGIADYLTFSSDDEAMLLKPERLLHLLLGWLYFAGSETCPCQATLGKYLMHLRVTAATGGRISFRAASIRYFAKPLTLIMMVMRFLTDASYTPRSTFHDRVAKTKVVLR